jgi:hypothetical protein
MNLLLDTHSLIWALEDNPGLSAEARAAIVDGNNIVFVSAVRVSGAVPGRVERPHRPGALARCHTHELRLTAEFS